MRSNSRCARRWGVILAGGNGERLRPLTRFIAGDDRPKQFCPLLPGGQTLLAMTRERIAKAVPVGRTLFVVTRNHEAFYSSELGGIPGRLLLEQPGNRGTLAAILASLAQLAKLDSRATVAFFPSDHYYSREQRFARGVRTAFAAAEAAPETVVLVGARALSPETGYGYIEPASPLHGVNPYLKSVGKFWEKPSPDVAQELVDRGCLWNTFVMVGRVQAFVELVRETAPDFFEAFRSAFSNPTGESLRMDEIYQQIPEADFSRTVLSAGIARTAVLDLGDIGWSDLGDPQRLIATLSRHGIPNPWRQLWLREMGIAQLAG